MMRFWRDRSIRFRPDRRRPDDWADVHDRARSLAAERLTEPLGPGDAAWLAEHLATCPSCREVATAYERQQAALRALGAPEPPRDLWARTAAALDREAAHRRGSRRGDRGPRRTAAPRSPLGRLVPYGTLAGVLVVAVVVGASILARRTPPVVPGSPAPSPIASLSMATPIPIPAGPVAWLERRDDGTYALAVASVGQVCPGTSGLDCPPITAPLEIALALEGEPRAVVRSPASDRLVVVVRGPSGGQILVVPLPSPVPGPTPTQAAPSVSPTASSPTASVGPTASLGRPRSSPSGAAGTPVPSPISSPTPTGSSAPPASEPPSSEEPASEAPASEAPASTPVASGSPAPNPSETAAVSPTGTPPSPSAAPLEPVAILDGAMSVGDTAAWSPSGRWLAFSARPMDASGGPDVYVWSPDEPRARPLTTDGRSIFSAWLGERIVASRAEDRSDGGAGDLVVASGRSFLVDPETGTETPIDGVEMWRPVVDPTGRWAVYWHGSLRLADDGRTWLPNPDSGVLVLGPWPGGPPADVYGPETNDGASAAPDEGGVRPTASPAGDDPPAFGSASPSPAASSDASPSASSAPSDLELPEGLTALVAGDLRDWEVRWDPTGTRFAVWVADPVDPSVGRLSLFTIDPTTGTLDPAGVALRDEPALAGFALGLGRLAWAVPPGQGGEPSHVRILAWTGTEVGTAVSQPAPGTVPVIVVR